MYCEGEGRKEIDIKSERVVLGLDVLVRESKRVEEESNLLHHVRKLSEWKKKPARRDQSVSWPILFVAEIGKIWREK